MSEIPVEGTCVLHRLRKLWVQTIGCCLVLAHYPTVHSADTPPVTAITTTRSDQPSTNFRSPGQFLVESLIVPWHERLKDLGMATQTFPRKSQPSRSYTPLRQFTLLGGDRICAELVRWENDLIELRTRGGRTVSVPREAVASLQVPPGEVELLSESFEFDIDAPASDTLLSVRPRLSDLDSTQSLDGQRSLRLTPQAEPLTINLPTLAGSRIQFWARAAEQHQSEPGALTVELELPSASTQRRTIRISDSRARVTDATGERTFNEIPLNPGWHCFSLIDTPKGSLWTVDRYLLSWNSQPSGAIHFMRFSSSSQAWVDALLVSSLTGNAADAIPSPSTQDDVVLTTDGLQRFGKLRSVDAAGVRLSVVGQEQVIVWSRVVSLSLRQPDRPVFQRLPLSCGMMAEIEFQTSADRPLLLPDRLNVSIQEVSRDFISVAHPWLGTLAIAWSDVGRIKPDFFGQSILLDARQIHLGDAIEAAFRRQMPDGTEWSSDFDLPDKVRRAASQFQLVMDVSELEPSGPQTPPGSRFLRELRDGQLLTQLTLNETSAGDVNHRLRFRTPPGQSERIQIPLPARLFRSGHNALKLQQVPLTKTGAFDNCELSNLRLEILQ